MIKLKVNLSIGYPNAERNDIIEIDESEIEGKTHIQKMEYFDRITKEWAFNYIEYSLEITE